MHEIVEQGWINVLSNKLEAKFSSFNYNLKNSIHREAKVWFFLYCAKIPLECNEFSTTVLFE